ncbi:MAG: shikimate kinase I [Gammaproteobacteria bacterium]|nr:MAG: shikimate kinase I [Gammaproteobacteria bacterium]
MADGKNIYLVGPMGVGKTTVGKKLAELTRFTFYDVDQEVEARTGTTVSIIFEIEGEDGFRAWETRVLGELAESGGAVIATGGGAVIRPENRRIMRNTGTVVYLHADVKTQIRRTRYCKNRPILQNTDRREVLTRLMKEREPLYREVANCIITTDNRPAYKIARQIQKKIHL